MKTNGEVRHGRRRRAERTAARAPAPARVLALALALLLTLAACAASDGTDRTDGPPGGSDATDHDDAARAVEQYLDAVWPPEAGGTVLAARGDHLVTCVGRGLADHAAERAADCETVYDIGSMTKQFTAAAVLKLQMEGRLEVTDPLGRFFDDVPADRQDITVHHLLTHTAGLPEQLGDDYEPLSREELLRQAMAADRDAAPGTAYAYSNLGYSLLAAVVEVASGQGYEEYLADRLFAPAGMTRTGYALPTWEREAVAEQYDGRGRPQGRPQDHPWAADGPHWNLRGNGGMLSTAHDLFRWHLALLGDEVLDDAARAAMFTPHVSEGEEGGVESAYGYGWSVLTLGDVPLVTHDGGNGWSSGRITRFPDDDVLVFWITNQEARHGEWDIPGLDPDLTLGIAERLDAAAAGP